jgi:hypothetical protein
MSLRFLPTENGEKGQAAANYETYADIPVGHRWHRKALHCHSRKRRDPG